MGVPGGGAGPETVLDSTPGAKGGVSQKIQQLLNTLKRPKKNRRPIEEYYQDQDESKHTFKGHVDYRLVYNDHHGKGKYVVEGVEPSHRDQLKNRGQAGIREDVYH